MNDDTKLLEDALKKIKQYKSELKRFHEPIAVIGMGCRFPKGANSPEEYWNLLKNGIDGIEEIPHSRFDIDAYYDPEVGKANKIYTRKGSFIENLDFFDAEFFGISPIEAEEMDPQQRLLLHVVWEALEMSGIAPDTLRNSLTGVFAGVSNVDYGNVMLMNLDQGNVGGHSLTGNSLNAVSGRISYFLGLQGPSLAVDTACSSSMVSIHLACSSLQIGECHLAIAAGVNVILNPGIYQELSASHMLSPEGYCKTFDESADGFIRGEGIGALILKRLGDAIKDGDPILAVIKGSSVNQDGPSSGLSVPNGVAQEKLIRQCLEDAHCAPTDISYAEAHGTGTALGDPIEVNALTNVYCKERLTSNPLLIGSVKSNIGHLESAAGMSSVIKLILCLNKKEIPANLHFKKLNPKIDLSKLPVKIIDKNMPWGLGNNTKRIGAASGFGVTGTNAHVILEEYEYPVVVNQTDTKLKNHVLVLSAKSQKALDALIERYIPFLESTEEELHTICYSAALGRMHHKFRVAVVAEQIESMLDKLKKREYYSILTETDGVENQNRADILKKYLEGHSVDWKAYYLPYGGKKIVLPSYPFQYKRVWSPLVKSSVKRAHLPSNIHPYLSERMENPGLKGVIFESLIDYNWPVFVSDHLIYGYPVLAGVSYLSALLSVIKELSPSGCGEISEVNWVRPFVFQKGEQRILQIALHATDIENKFWFEALSRDANRPYKFDWLTHVRGVITLLPEFQYDSSYESMEAIRARLPFHYTATDLYDGFFPKVELDLGHQFRWLMTMDLSDDEAFGQLREPENRIESEPYVLHPGYIDSVAQLLLAFMMKEGKDMLSIPLYVKSIWYDPKAGYPRFAHLIKKQDGDNEVGTFVLLNDKGQRVGGIEGARLRQVPKNTLLRAYSDVESLMYEWVVEEYVPLASHVTTNKWNVIGDTDVAKNLTGIIESKGGIVNDFTQPYRTIFAVKIETLEDLNTSLFSKIEEAITKNTSLPLIIFSEGPVYFESIIRSRFATRLDMPLMLIHVEAGYNEDSLFTLLNGDNLEPLVRLKGTSITVPRLVTHRATRELNKSEKESLREIINPDSSYLIMTDLDESAAKLSSLLQANGAKKILIKKAVEVDQHFLTTHSPSGIFYVENARLSNEAINYVNKHAASLDLFVVFPSISSVIGEPQDQETLLNDALKESFFHYRVNQSLSAHCLYCDKWTDDLVRGIETALLMEQSATVITRLNWKNLLKVKPAIPTWLIALADTQIDTNSLVDQLERIESNARLALVKSYVTDIVRGVVGFLPSQSIDESAGFFDMGLDSIMAIELRTQLQAGLDQKATLEATDMFDHATIEKMTQHLATLLKIEGIKVRKKEASAKTFTADEPIAIIGMSCRFPGGAVTTEAYWDVLKNSVDGIIQIPSDRWDAETYYDPDPQAEGKMVTKLGGFLSVDVSQFDADFFKIAPREAEYMDPQHRLLLEVTYEALKSAGIELKDIKESATGVFMGLCSHDYLDLITASGDKSLINPYLATGNAASTATGRISFLLGLQGPNFAVDTACSSSLVAIDSACQSLRSGDANLALAGGVNLILSPDLSINFSKAGMLASDGHCKTFDAAADGYVRGEGCGVIVLKRLSDAMRDGDLILATIKASGINQDGASSGLTVPNGAAQEALIQKVLGRAKLQGSDIDYMEAHGTGTPLGDPIEMRAIGVTYGKREASLPLRIGSVKTNIGHLEGAAGIASVIKVILSLQNEKIPANLHFNTLNPLINLNFPAEIVTKVSDWKRGQHVRRAAISSFGFSGTNAHLILEEGPPSSGVFNPVMPAFNRQHYWAPKAKVHLGRTLDSVHPLLGERHTSPNGDIYFLGELNIAQLPYLKAHEVFTDLIFPGAGHVEMMLASGLHGLDLDSMILEDVSFEAALRLDYQHPTPIQVIMTPDEAGHAVAIYSQNKQGIWQAHAKGLLSNGPQERLDNVDVEALKSRCSVAIAKRDVYQHLAQFGLHLGDDFQTMGEIYTGGKESLALVTSSGSVQGYLAHPALLDGCFQSLIAALWNEKEPALYLPIGCDSVSIYAPLGDSVYVSCKNVQSTDMEVSGDMTVFNSSGKVLANVRGFHAHKTTQIALKRLLSHENTIDNYLYEWAWQNHVLKTQPPVQPAGKWLILGDGQVSDVLNQLLKKNAVGCHLVCNEDMPQSKEAFTALINAEIFTAIVHISNGGEAGVFSAQSIKSSQDKGLKNLLHLTQALIASPLTLNIPLTVVTQNSTGTNLDQSPLNGFIKTIVGEQPTLKLKQIDLGNEWDPTLLLRLLCSTEREGIYAINSNECLVPRLVRVAAQDSDSINHHIRADGTYLITGGLGGLGLTLGKWLIAQGAGGIVLTGRRALDDEIKAQLYTLDEQNKVITYKSLDINEESAVASLLPQLHALPKPLKGIFHLAGVVDDALLADQDWAHFEGVFAAKVYGSFYLHQYSQDLDLFVLFSSIASSLGSPGQSNYAAANGFMDALATYRRQKGLPAQSLSWGPWAEVGMAKDLLTRHVKSGFLGIKPKEGLQALEKLLACEDTNITIANIDWKKYSRQLVEVPQWFEFLAPRTRDEHNLQTQLESVAANMRLPLIKRYVSDVVRTVLGGSGGQDIDEKKRFFDMGLDSLMAIELKNRLQLGLGAMMRLSGSVVFEYPSIEQMTNYIAGDVATDEPALTSTQNNLMTTIMSTKWVLREQVVHSPMRRVFCFHHAGGSASVFREWQQKMPEGVELCAIQLPGREERSEEPLIHEMDAVVYGVLQGIMPLLDKPFIFFGHSMGAMLAYQVAKMLDKMGLPHPTQLILSGFSPLDFDKKKATDMIKLDAMDDEHFIVHLTEFAEGIPDSALHNPEAMAVVLPLIRADFSLLSKPFAVAPRLDIPIITVHAIDDKGMAEKEVMLWSKATTGTCIHHRVPGGHLGLLDNPNPYIDVVLDALNSNTGE